MVHQGMDPSRTRRTGQGVFFSKDWTEIGTKDTLSKVLSSRTRIDEIILRGGSLHDASVSKRMSWASGRVTTWEEDMAYSLLGIFDVNMPLIYGEGEKAFTRLQEEILKISDDQTLFVWTASEKDGSTPPNTLLRGLLAQSPDDFAECGDIVPFARSSSNEAYAMTNKGLRIAMTLIHQDTGNDPHNYLAVLDCYKTNNYDGPIAIFLRRLDMMGDQFARSATLYPIVLTAKYRVMNGYLSGPAQKQIIYFKHHTRGRDTDYGPIRFHIRSIPSGVRVLDTYPGGSDWEWNEQEHFITAMREGVNFVAAFKLEDRSTFVLSADDENKTSPSCVILAAVEPQLQPVPEPHERMSLVIQGKQPPAGPLERLSLAQHPAGTLLEGMDLSFFEEWTRGKHVGVFQFSSTRPPPGRDFFGSSKRQPRSGRQLRISLSADLIPNVRIYHIDISFERTRARRGWMSMFRSDSSDSSDGDSDPDLIY